MSDSLQPHGLQHTRLPCPSLFPRIFSKSRPLSRWCHPIISSSVAPFSCPQSFPVSGAFPMNWLFASGGQSTGTSSSALSSCTEYSGLISSRIDWFDLLAVQGTLKSLLQHHSSKVSILQCSAFFMVQLSHLYMLTRKTIALIIQTFVSKVMSLFFLIIPCHPSDLSPRVSQSKSRFLRNGYNFAIVYMNVSLPWQNYKSLSARAGNTFSLHLAFNSVWDVIDI